MPPRPVRWARVTDHYADLRGEADHFLALDGNVEVGVVKLVEMGPRQGFGPKLHTGAAAACARAGVEAGCSRAAAPDSLFDGAFWCFRGFGGGGESCDQGSDEG